MALLPIVLPVLLITSATGMASLGLDEAGAWWQEVVFKQCFRAFFDAIENGGSGESLYLSFEEGHHEVTLCDAMLKSNREERWITRYVFG